MASLLNRKIKSRLLLRDPEKATALFGEQDEEALQVPDNFTVDYGPDIVFHHLLPCSFLFYRLSLQGETQFFLLLTFYW